MIRHSEENSGGKMTSALRESFFFFSFKKKKKEFRTPLSLSLSLSRYHSRLRSLCVSRLFAGSEPRRRIVKYLPQLRSDANESIANAARMNESERDPCGEPLEMFRHATFTRSRSNHLPVR